MPSPAGGDLKLPDMDRLLQIDLSKVTDMKLGTRSVQNLYLGVLDTIYGGVLDPANRKTPSTVDDIVRGGAVTRSSSPQRNEATRLAAEAAAEMAAARKALAEANLAKASAELALAEADAAKAAAARATEEAEQARAAVEMAGVAEKWKAVLTAEEAAREQVEVPLVAVGVVPRG